MEVIRLIFKKILLMLMTTSMTGCALFQVDHDHYPSPGDLCVYDVDVSNVRGSAERCLAAYRTK